MRSSPSRKPPEWIRKILSLFLTDRLLEASLGDLEEKYHTNLDGGMSRWSANVRYVLEGIGFLRMAKRPSSASLQASVNLLTHTITFFGRLVRRDLGYYSVSLAGLTISLASFILITMFIRDELAYDQFHRNKERIYRLTTHVKVSDVAYDLATSQFPAADALQREIPEVEHAVRVYPQELGFKMDGQKHVEQTVMVDRNFFDVFSFEVISGDVSSALTNAASVVLTEKLARKYFGDLDAVNRTVVVDDQSLTVTAIIKDIPDQSHLQFSAVIPLQLQLNKWKGETGIEGRENKWFWIGAYTYLQLRKITSYKTVNAKLPVIIDKYFPDRYKQEGAFRLQPLTDIHLTSGLANEIGAPGNILYVQLFSIVAIVIMVVCGINLINLSSFKIGSRMREVGIRKFLGQNSFRIILQLALESVMMGTIAFVLATTCCGLVIPAFNVLVEKKLEISSVPNLLIIAMTLVIIITICLISVIRPAIRYANGSTRTLLLQRVGSPGQVLERNILLGLQVCFSFVLLVFSFVISGQIDLFKNKNLGFAKDDVVVIELNEDFWLHTESFKTELKKHATIADVSFGPAPGGDHHGWRFVPEGGSEEKPFLFSLAWVDPDYLSTLQISLVEGEDLRSWTLHEHDSLWPFLINRSAAVQLGWAGDALNRKMKVFAAGTTNIMAEGRVIGVMEDYHYESLHHPVKPVVLTLTDGFGSALVRIGSDSTQLAIGDMQRTWKRFTDKPFHYELLDSRLHGLYSNEEKFSNVILFFTAIAIYLTCYGMFALSSLLFRSRLKEVSIRKIFGADQLNILRKFYFRYAAFTVGSILVGVPLSVYVGNLWLQTFEYRIELSPAFFVKAGIAVLAVGLVSVSYYLIRVASSNPVKFLRSE